MMKWITAVAACGILSTGCVDTDPSGLSTPLIECAFGTAARLAPGEAVQQESGTHYCVEADADATYVLVPFIAAERDSALHVTIQLYGGGFDAVPDGTPIDGPWKAMAAVNEVVAAGDAVHDLVRGMEHELLAGRTSHVKMTRVRDGSAVAGTSRVGGDDPVSVGGAIVIGEQVSAFVPDIGSLVSIDVSTVCDQIDLRVGRIAAVGTHVAVVVDTANPADGFTEEDWLRYAREYDEIVHPVVTGVFGEPTDIDENGRVLLFFTRAVNEIVPPGTIGIAGGYFWSGDLFPRAGIPGRTVPCASSNEAEVLYLAVPDPEGIIRVRILASTLRQVMTATIGHELQHLLSGGRRLYTTGADSFEETWLNEGLSYIAEELLFYHVAGSAPRQNIGVADVLGSQLVTDAFNQFAYNNLGRLNVYLLAPHDYSPIGGNDIPTRGAAWSYLRYVLDRHSADETEVLRSLMDGTSTGLDNLRAALGAEPLEWMRDWSISLAVDDLLPGIESRFQQPSWNVRELIAAARIDREYPLSLVPLEEGPGISIRLQPGGTAYPAFRLRAGSRAIVFLNGDNPNGTTIHSTLVRIN